MKTVRDYLRRGRHQALVLRRKFNTWSGLPWADRARILQAWLLLAYADWMIHTRPFDRIAPRLGSQQAHDFPPPALSQSHVRRARAIAVAVTRAAKYTPWPARCLAQAWVTRMLLERAGISCLIRLGLRRNTQPPVATTDSLAAWRDDDLTAHAWLESGEWILTGGAPSPTQYTAVVSFLCLVHGGYD